MSQQAANYESREQVGQHGRDEADAAGRGHCIASVDAAKREHASVQRYFDRFAAALTSGDLKTMTKPWGVPAFVIGEREGRVVQSEIEVEQFFEGAKEMYNRRGVVGTRGEIVDLDWVTHDLVIARVRWPHLDVSDHVVGEESSSYTLLRGEDGGFKLRVITLRGATTNGDVAP